MDWNTSTADTCWHSLSWKKKVSLVIKRFIIVICITSITNAIIISLIISSVCAFNVIIIITWCLFMYSFIHLLIIYLFLDSFMGKYSYRDYCNDSYSYPPSCLFKKGEKIQRMMIILIAQILLMIKPIISGSW